MVRVVVRVVVAVVVGVVVSDAVGVDVCELVGVVVGDTVAVVVAVVISQSRNSPDRCASIILLRMTAVVSHISSRKMSFTKQSMATSGAATPSGRAL